MSTASGRWVRYGVDAAHALREAIAEVKGDEPLAPVTVVVPSNQVGVSTRRLLASGRLGPVCGAGDGLIGVTFVTPYRLAELLGAATLAAQGRRPVSVPVLGAAVRQALHTQPGAFGPVAQHAATETALVAAYRELRDLDAATLDALAASSTRAGEVVRVHRAARALLEAAWYDEEDLMVAATAVATGHGVPPEVGAVVVHLPHRLSRHAAQLLAALGATDRLTVLAGVTGLPKADAEVVRSIDRLGVAIGPPPTEPVLPSIVSPDATEILTASDADDEVRAAVRRVVDAVRAGTSLDRIAIVHAAPQPYARLLQHHLDAAGIPTNGSATLPLAGRLVGRTLLGLLALPETGFRRQDVFAWLSGAPLLHQGRPVPLTAWERASRDAGVVAGRSDWDRHLQHFVHGRLRRATARAAAAAEAGEDPALAAESLRREADAAAELRTFVLGLADRLAEADAPRTWAERVRWAKRLLTDLLGGPSRRTAWPEDERRAADRVILALDRLAALDHLEGPVDLAVFTRALAVELEADLGRSGRFGEGVLVGPVSLAVGVDLDLVIVVGMAEGSFPSTLRDDSLLPDEDRSSAGGALPLRSAQVDRLHHELLAVLGGASRQVLCVPKGDLRRSRERVPSRWVLDAASVLAGETWWSDDLLHRDAPWLTHLASFDAAVRTSVPATDQEHRLRRLLAADAPRHQLADATAFDPGLAAGVHLLDQRTSGRLTRFDGNLAGLPIPSPLSGRASATSLEQWATCPHGYFVRHVLGIRPIEQPEDVLQITPLDRGNLVHEALERFIDEAITEGRVPPSGSPWTTEDRARMAQLATQLCEEAEAGGVTGRTLFWQRDRAKILADLDRFLTSDDAHRAATGAVPFAAELAFGGRSPLTVAFPLDGGRVIELVGKIDRVDATPSGSLHVLDYKTGKPDKFKRLSPADPHQAGTHLQLAVYGLAARAAAGAPDAPVRAEYWMTSARGAFAKYGYDITDEVLAEVSAAMSTIVDGIEHGLFVARPDPSKDSAPFVICPACNPDGLGTTELFVLWERKQSDPALRRYLSLIDPTPEDDPAAADAAPTGGGA